MGNESGKEISAVDDDGAMSAMGDMIGDLVSGVPAPVRKNAWKAFGQLCTAVVSIPVAALEGLAAERRALADARVRSIATVGERMADQVEVETEYSRAAVRKYGEKILRERVNLDKVCEIAASEIRNATPAALPPGQEPTRAESEQGARDEPDVTPISEDWLNHFEGEAAKASTEDMRLLFGRILAREIQVPKTFSVKTVRLLSGLDPVVASSFQRFCSLCITFRAHMEQSPGEYYILDSRVVELEKPASANGLQDYGLPYDVLNRLNEHDLIINDYNSYYDYGFSVVGGDNSMWSAFYYQGQNWALISEIERPKPAGSPFVEFRINGVALSASGKELSKIIDIKQDEKHTEHMRQFFKSKNVQMVPVQIRTDREPDAAVEG